MSLSLFYALLPVALGALLGLLPGLGDRLKGPLQAFAVAAALAVVLTHLLPESIESIGMVLALGLFLLGMIGPMLIELLSHRYDTGHGHALDLELGYLGLAAHQMLHGLQIGASQQLHFGLGLVLRSPPMRCP